MTQKLISFYILVLLLHACSQESTHTSSINLGDIPCLLVEPPSNNKNVLLIMVQGTGTGDIDYTISFEKKCLWPDYSIDSFAMFQSLSLFLADSGITSLRYLKLSSRVPNYFDDPNSTPNDDVEELQNLVNKVSKLKRFEKHKILILGHSRGASMSTYLKDNDNVAGIISIGGLYKDPVRNCANQFYSSLKNCENEVERGKKYQAQLMYKLLEPNPNSKLIILSDTTKVESHELVISNSIGYFKYWNDEIHLFRNGVNNIEAIAVPMLFIHGELDINVPFENLEFMSNKYRDNPQFTFQGFANTDHYLLRKDDFKINTEACQTIAHWIDNTIIKEE